VFLVCGLLEGAFNNVYILRHTIYVSRCRKMTNIFGRVKSGNSAQRQIARHLLVQNFGVFPACCCSFKDAKISCERYEHLTKDRCLECQKEVLRVFK